MELVLDEQIIFPQLAAESKNDLFQIISSKLLEKDLVAESYANEIIEREEKFPTGLPTALPISLCHTDSNIVKKSFLTLATLKNPIEFREMGNANNTLEVKIAFFLGIIEGKEHISLLREIMKIVRSEEILSNIYSSKSGREIKDILNKHLIFSANIKINQSEEK